MRSGVKNDGGIVPLAVGRGAFCGVGNELGILTAEILDFVRTDRDHFLNLLRFRRCGR